MFMATKLKWAAVVLFIVLGVWAVLHNGIEPGVSSSWNCVGPRAPLLCIQKGR
jgi:hypothetical protein